MNAHTTNSPAASHPTKLGIITLVVSVVVGAVFPLVSPLLAVVLIGYGLWFRRAHPERPTYGNWVLASGVVVALVAIGVYAGLGTTAEFSSTV